jgi:signal transduction histidine kinase
MRSWTTAGPAELERRTRPLVTVVPYVLLAGLAALTVVIKRDRPGSLATDLGLCAAAAVWMLVMFTLRPRSPQVFLTVLILLGLVLAARDPWFGFFSPALYFYAFRIIGWPRELYFIAGSAVVAGTAQASGLDARSGTDWLIYLAVLIANILPMCALAWFGVLTERYYTGREAALDEAREANRRLTGALAENAVLQEQLVGQARSAGVLDERQRMAREIHDTLAQGLTGIVTQLQAAEHAAGDPARWRRHHAAATALARESLTEARRSVNELRPEPLETGRLADAVAGVAAAWSARTGVDARVTVTGDPRAMRPEAEVVLLRTAQEALANVAKHADATRVGLTLSYMDTQVALDVRDDGRGFDLRLPVREDGGFGLEAMRQRVEGLSGTLQIESEPGGGTGISACLPADQAEVRA